MRPTALLRLMLPQHLIPIFLDTVGIFGPERPVWEHIRCAAGWLCAAQDTAGDGVSAGYSLLSGWYPPYPETTGYIIPTFFDVAMACGLESLRCRAVRMAEWELGIQRPSGAIPSGLHCTESDPVNMPEETPPSVFNTGQVIFGWCRAYQETSDERFLEAALRAGLWIVDSQDEDGVWRRNLSPGPTTTLRTYKSRVAWALAELWCLTSEPRLRKVATRCLEWVLSQQQHNGYFKNAAFFPGEDPLTHGIAYCIEGLLEGGVLLEEARFVAAAKLALESLMRRFEMKGELSARYNERWRETANFQCLAGNAQIARAWQRLYQLTGDARYLSSALKVNQFLKRTQNLWLPVTGVRGAIKGSHPIWGSRADSYQRFSYPNWAAKFFVDSLVLEEQIMAPLENRPVRLW